jgi:hypothetical protein
MFYNFLVTGDMPIEELIKQYATDTTDFPSDEESSEESSEGMV